MSDAFNQMYAQNYEPKRKYRWALIYDGLPAYALKTFARPKNTFEEIAVDYINTKRWLAGKFTWDEITLTMYDPIEESAAAAVVQWMYKNYNSKRSDTANYGRAGYNMLYKVPISLQSFDPLGNIAEEWLLKGAWVKTHDFGDLDYASSEAQEISCTIRYDDAELINYVLPTQLETTSPI